ncbi:MAG: sialate O-acetylesterase [Bacteroidales bacterium]
MRLAWRVLTVLALIMCARVASAQDERTRFFPRVTVYPGEMPPPEKVWLFVLAGQSNMAGRGLVEPSDTVPDHRIFFVTPDMKWAVAKEPLQLYQPALTGLGPGLAFARTLLEKVNEDIYIGLIPCAVGGSSTANWRTDSLYNGVRLKSNLTEKLKWAMNYGTVKGIIWHQGESDATVEKIPQFRENTEALFEYFRSVAGDPDLPVVAGELGLFQGVEKNRVEYLQINDILSSIASGDPNTVLVRSFGTTPKADMVHFDGPSQRMLGRRYALAWLSLIQHKNR